MSRVGAVTSRLLRRLHCVGLSVVLLMAAAPATFAWELTSRDEGAAALRISHQTAEVATANYVFWGPNFAWAGARLQFGDRRPDGAQRFHLAVEKLGISADGTIAAAKPNEIVWTYDFNVEKALSGISGGGLDFKLDLTADTLQGFKSDPQLLPDNTGWRWEAAKGQFLTVAFSEPIARVFFERGQKNNIRAMFFGPDVAAGKKAVTMKITLPEGGKQTIPLAERYGEADTAKWFSGALDPQASFIDLSDLNEKPAGKHGFVQAKGDQFVFSDGTPVRFWGANVQAYSLFVQAKDGKSPDKALIDRQARRIAQLGFNLIRLHHHDSGTWVRQNLIAPGETSQQLNEPALDSYFYWVKALKENGIYVWVDLHVGRAFREGDNIPGFEDLAGKTAQGARQDAGVTAKGYTHLNERIEELMKKFNEQLLTRVNPYTGLALKDEPVVMGMLLSNEDDLTNHFGNLFLPDKNHPFHQKIFERLAADFAKRHGLPLQEVGKTWVPGLSKLFLNDLEHAWSARMIAHLRGLGVKAPITSGHQWGNCPLFSLPALTVGDMIDAHTYENGEFLNDDPRFTPNFAHSIAASQLADRPLTITEYNSGASEVKDPFTIPLYLAGLAVFQGWDAPMLYGYSQDSFRGADFSPWSSYNLPHVMGLMPAAAVLFREGHVQPAKQTKFVQLDREKTYFRSVTVRNSRALRTALETHRLMIGLPDVAELDWDKATAVPPGAEVVSDLDKDFIPAGQSFVESDTGEMRRDWQKGIFTINTPKSQVASGWLGGEKIALADCSFEIVTPKATVALTSLDGQPLVGSRKILLSTAARAQLPKRNAPIRSEPVRGTVTLRSKAADFQLVPLKSDGSRQPAISLRHTGGAYEFEIPADQATHWFLLAPAK